MKVRDIMSSDPACCRPSSTVEEAARLMTERNCGEIPVVDSQQKPVGVVTDRDIACRVVADPLSAAFWVSLRATGRPALAAVDVSCACRFWTALTRSAKPSDALALAALGLLREPRQWDIPRAISHRASTL